MQYIINWDKIQSLEQMIEVMKTLNLVIENPPKELVEKGLFEVRVNPYTVPLSHKPRKVSKKEKAIIQNFNSVTGSNLLNIIQNL